MKLSKIIAVTAVLSLTGCATNWTPEEAAAIQAKQRAQKVDHISFDDLKDEYAVFQQSDPQ